MSLFSWFSQKHPSAIKRDDKAAIKKELATFNKNTMWPMAQVRKETVDSQQIYVEGLGEKLSDTLNSQDTKKTTSTLPPEAVAPAVFK